MSRLVQRIVNNLSTPRSLPAKYSGGCERLAERAHNAAKLELRIQPRNQKGGPFCV